MKKKLFTFLLIFSTMFALCACGGGTDGGPEDNTDVKPDASSSASSNMTYEYIKSLGDISKAIYIEADTEFDGEPAVITMADKNGLQFTRVVQGDDMISTVTDREKLMMYYMIDTDKTYYEFPLSDEELKETSVFTDQLLAVTGDEQPVSGESTTDGVVYKYEEFDDKDIAGNKVRYCYDDSGRMVYIQNVTGDEVTSQIKINEMNGDPDDSLFVIPSDYKLIS